MLHIMTTFIGYRLSNIIECFALVVLCFYNFFLIFADNNNKTISGFANEHLCMLLQNSCFDSLGPSKMTLQLNIIRIFIEEHFEDRIILLYGNYSIVSCLFTLIVLKSSLYQGFKRNAFCGYLFRDTIAVHICAEILFFLKFAPNQRQNANNNKMKFNTISKIRETTTKKKIVEKVRVENGES